MYLNSRIGEGDADAIGCPYILEEVKGHRQCKVLVGEEVLKEIMDAASYQKLMDQKNSAFVRKNVDYHHCPTPDCTNIILCKSVEMLNIDNESNDGADEIPRVCDCFKCGRQTCLSCGASPFHKDMSCNEYREELRLRDEEKRMQHERMRRYNPTFEPMRSCLRGASSSYRHRNDANLERLRQIRLQGELGVYQHTTKAETQYEFQPNPSTSNNNDEEETQLNNIKRCRRCGNGIELRDGCLKMKCICGYRFCYQCGSENAQCGCTGDSHGFHDQETGWGDFAGLREKTSYT